MAGGTGIGEMDVLKAESASCRKCVGKAHGTSNNGLITVGTNLTHKAETGCGSGCTH